MGRILPLLVSAALLLLGTACSEQPEPAPAAPQPLESKPVRQVLEVVVPDAVAGQWQSVKLAVRDLQTDSEEIYTVDIGGSFQLPKEQLQVTVATFLPAFVMDGKWITSASNKATNPAVRIRIEEAGQEVYDGWLFGLYPDPHAYQHPRYNFTLLSYKPAGQKKG